MNHLFIKLLSVVSVGLLFVMGNYGHAFEACDINALVDSFEYDNTSQAAMEAEAFFDNLDNDGLGIEMTCCTKILIDHHRKYGISKENKERLIVAMNRVGVGTETLLRSLVEGVDTIEIEECYVMGNGRDNCVSMRRYEAFEEDESRQEDLQKCDELAQLTYMEAFNRYLELFELVYQKCIKWTSLLSLAGMQ